jgi:amidohydrolase
MKELFAGSDVPMTLTVYGTPAEETYGGKIIMQEAGCFKELDICLGTHATRSKAFVGGSSMALTSYVVTYHGKSAHASGSPWLGRSAMDAMLLTFQGLEFLREHVKDGTRMHYSIKEAIGPSNVVPQRACAGFTLRSKNNDYLPELDERFRKVVNGACMMTDTTCDFEKKPTYLARKRNNTLSAVAKANYDALGIETTDPLVVDSNGSTDFGNVSGIVPGILVYLHYIDAPGHSDEWVAAGKTDDAKRCLLQSTQMLATLMHDLVLDPAIIQAAKEEFDKA